MRVFFDTNVVVAACLEDHEHHEAAFGLLSRVLAGQDCGVISAHALVETYAVMTRLPRPLRVPANAAAKMLRENIVKHFEVIALTAEEYGKLLGEAGKEGWIGGLIYDALHLACARKAGIECLFSWNAAHLRTVAGDDLAERVAVP